MSSHLFFKYMVFKCVLLIDDLGYLKSSKFFCRTESAEELIVDDKYLSPKIVNYCSDRSWFWSAII